jgi:phosphoribosylformimino-5-aminoimidazole carboxamide ribonucleotide (ProFAR) isomerase
MKMCHSCDGSEFLVHAADVEGLCQGIDEDLVARASTRNLALQR